MCSLALHCRSDARQQAIFPTRSEWGLLPAARLLTRAARVRGSGGAQDGACCQQPACLRARLGYACCLLT